MTLDMKITDEKEITAPKENILLEKPKRKKRIGLWITLAVIAIILGGLGFVIFKGVSIFEKIGLKIDSGSLSLMNVEPELKKDSTGKYTNFLIIGIDTRENAGGLNTDTLMLVSYNYDTKDIVMISVPRDFYVEIGDGSKWYDKINAVYAFTRDENDKVGLQELQRTVEEVTGTEIQYYAMVNFEAFTQIVDSVGGVDINVENSFTDYSYPLGLKYQTVSFKAGIQHMDGETALKYARSRHSSDNGEGLDYMRARRQQKVVMAVKDKILSTSTLTSPKAVMGLISSVSDNIQISEFTISDIQAGLNLAKAFNDNGSLSYSFVLEPLAGNSEIIISSDLGSSHQEPKLGLGKYTDINEYVDIIMTKPQLYSENAKIYVYNAGLGYQEA